jgi:hypothetical protein
LLIFTNFYTLDSAGDIGKPWMKPWIRMEVQEKKQIEFCSVQPFFFENLNSLIKAKIKPTSSPAWTPG